VKIDTIFADVDITVLTYLEREGATEYDDVVDQGGASAARVGSTRFE